VPGWRSKAAVCCARAGVGDVFIVVTSVGASAWTLGEICWVLEVGAVCIGSSPISLSKFSMVGRLLVVALLAVPAGILLCKRFRMGEVAGCNIGFQQRARTNTVWLIPFTYHIVTLVKGLALINSCFHLSISCQRHRFEDALYAKNSIKLCLETMPSPIFAADSGISISVSASFAIETVSEVVTGFDALFNVQTCPFLAAILLRTTVLSAAGVAMGA